MTNQYINTLEDLIKKMKNSLNQGNSEVIQSEYALWLDFLRKVNPESNLLKNEQDLMLDSEFGKPLKKLSGIRDIMDMAREQEYPTWFIQPKFSDDRFIFEYEEGKLKSVTQNSLLQDIQTLVGFTGKISGQIHNSQFLAYDTDRHIQFLKKMKYLENLKLKTPEFVLFPTEKIAEISSTQLERIFHNYISKAQEGGLKVDGVVIVSDTPMFMPDDDVSSRKVAFTLG